MSKASRLPKVVVYNNGVTVDGVEIRAVSYGSVKVHTALESGMPTIEMTVLAESVEVRADQVPEEDG